MQTKDQTLLEQAYQQVMEATTPQETEYNGGMINQYEIQSKNDDGTWEICVQFSGEQYDTLEAMDMMIDRLQMYRDAYEDGMGKFRLIHITQRTLA